MLRFLKITLLAGIMGVIVFGMFSMLHSGNGAFHGSCIPMMGGGDECNSSVRPFEYISVHMSTFSLLASQAARAEGLGIILLVLCLVLFDTYINEVNVPSAFPIGAVRASVHTRDVFKKRRGWLAIHEKRDPSLF